MVETRDGHGHDVQAHAGGHQIDSLLVVQPLGHNAAGAFTPGAGNLLVGGNIGGGLKQELLGQLGHGHFVEHGENVVRRQDDHGQLLVKADAVVLLAVGAGRLVVGAQDAHVGEGVLGNLHSLDRCGLCVVCGACRFGAFRRLRVDQLQVLVKGVQSARLAHGHLGQGHAVAVAFVPAVEPLAGHNAGHVAHAQGRALQNRHG